MNTNRVIAPLYIIFKDVQDKRLWSDKLGKLINPLVVRSTQLHNKSEDISRLNINQKRRKKLASLSFAFATSGVSISALCHFPLVSSTRLCVDHSAQRVASQQSLSPPTQSGQTRRCLLLLSLSISLSFFGPASPSHTLTSPERSLLLPGFSLSSPLPISSTDRSLLHGRQKHRFFLRSLSSHSPLSVALFLS